MSKYSSLCPDPVCLAEIEKEAKKKLSGRILGYFEGGADDELTFTENIDAFKRSVEKHAGWPVECFVLFHIQLRLITKNENDNKHFKYVKYCLQDVKGELGMSQNTYGLHANYCAPMEVC